MVNTMFKNMKICRKYQINDNIIDLTDFKWSEKNERGRPHQITLIIMNINESTDNQMFPYERYIRSTEDYQRKNDDLKHCDNCSHFKVCPNYGAGKCPGFEPMPRASVVVTQEHGFAWVIFNTKDLQFESKRVSEQNREAKVRKCPKCQSTKIMSLYNNKFRCAECAHLWHEDTGVTETRR